MTSTLLTKETTPAPLARFIDQRVLNLEHRLACEYVGSEDLETIANAAHDAAVPMLAVCASAPVERRRDAFAIWRKNEWSRACSHEILVAYLKTAPEKAAALRDGLHPLAEVDAAAAAWLDERNTRLARLKVEMKQKLNAAIRGHLMDADELPHDGQLQAGFLVITANGEMKVSRRFHHAMAFGRASGTAFRLMTCAPEKHGLYIPDDDALLHKIDAETGKPTSSATPAGASSIETSTGVQAPAGDEAEQGADDETPAAVEGLDITAPSTAAADESRPASARGLGASNAPRGRKESSS